MHIFGRRKRSSDQPPSERETAEKHVLEDAAAPEPTVLVPENPLYPLASFAVLQQRVLDNLIGEINQTSLDMETQVDHVGAAFKEISTRAKRQVERVEQLSNLATGVHLADGNVEIQDVTELFRETQSDIISKVVFLSKHTMEVVYTLNSITETLRHVETCVKQVNDVNRRATILALNARIEAVRAGEAGKAFAVVADEIRELSSSTQSLASSMQHHLGAVVGGIASSQEALQKVAMIDLSGSLDSKDRLDKLIDALVARNTQLAEILAESASDTVEVSRQTSDIVTRMQFQDRTKQHLDQVTSTISSVGAAVQTLLAESAAADPNTPLTESERDILWVREVAENHTLTEMRRRFISEVLGPQAGEPAPDDADAVGTIELF